MTTPVDALQRTLAAEHAAVYAYGVLGGRTSQSGSPELFAALSAAYAEHRARRDELVATLRDLLVEPVAADDAYRVTGETAPRRVAAAALDLERRCADVYAALVADTRDEQRRWAVEALTATAVRGLDFGGAPEPFPGAGELTP